MNFKVDLINYKGIYRSIETSKLNVPTSEGRRTILSNHMPIMIPLTMGIIETEYEGELSHFVINSGVMYFKDNVAEVVVNNIVDVKDIDVKRAENLKERASKELGRIESEALRAREQFKVDLADTMLEAVARYNSHN